MNGPIRNIVPRTKPTTCVVEERGPNDRPPLPGSVCLDDEANGHEPVRLFLIAAETKSFRHWYGKRYARSQDLERFLSYYRHMLSEYAMSTFPGYSRQPLRDGGGPDERPETVGDVYFIQGVSGGPIKIGTSEDPYVRMASLQVACHEKLRLLATTAGGKQREAELHARFAATRVRGEWFGPSDELLALIGSL